MIKLEHFNGGGINHTKFLVDYNPGKHICSREYTIYTDKFINFIQATDEEFLIIGHNFFNKKLAFIAEEYSRYTEIVFHYVRDEFDITVFNEKIKECLFEVNDDNELPTISFISIKNNTPCLINRNLPNKIEIDLENSYNLSYDLQNVMDIVKSDKSGLILFTGEPGTGKSTLIKYLSQINKDVDFCFVPNNNLDILSNPQFISFCIESLSNSVIILEDCEKLLLSRDVNNGYDISNILNLTDGVYGDLLNIKFIATLNTYDKIDTALLRKGRLLCKAEFKKLTIDQGNNLAKKLGKNITIDKELPLCEIYNLENTGVNNEIKQKVGFAI